MQTLLAATVDAAVVVANASLLPYDSSNY